MANISIQIELAKINDKLDLLITAKADQETRIRTLEAISNQSKGGVRVFMFVAGVVGTISGIIGGIIASIMKLNKIP